MSVRTAVATRDAAIEAAPAPEPLHVLARKAIERQAVVLQQILPQHMSMARFEQIALAQVKGTPGLLRCFETAEGQVSLLYSVVQAAAAGLELLVIDSNAPHQLVDGAREHAVAELVEHPLPRLDVRGEPAPRLQGVGGGEAAEREQEERK